MSSSDDDDEDLKDMIDFGANVRRQSDVSNRMAGRISVNPKLLAAGDIFTRNYKKSDFKIYISIEVEVRITFLMICLFD